MSIHSQNTRKHLLLMTTKFLYYYKTHLYQHKYTENVKDLYAYNGIRPNLPQSWKTVEGLQKAIICLYNSIGLLIIDNVFISLVS